MANPPPELQVAINSSSQKYGVPTSVLTRVWNVESGGNFPNPYVNSSGYGGLFGTKLWNAPTQTQSDYAASILATGYQKYGNWEDALSYYRTGQPGKGYPGGNSMSGGVIPGQPKSGGGAPSTSSNPLSGLDIPGAINNFTSTLQSDIKGVGISLGIGVLGVLLIIAGIIVIIAPAAKSVAETVKPV